MAMRKKNGRTTIKPAGKTKPTNNFPLTPVTDAHPDVRILAELPGVDGALWQLCLHPFSYRRSENPDISALVDRGNGNGTGSLHNVFYDPAFLAASRMRIERRQMAQLILWEEEAGGRTPRFCVPVFEEDRSFFQTEHLRNVVHPFAPVGTPLAPDDQDADRVAVKLAELLEQALENGAPPIILRMVTCSPFMDALGEHIRARIGPIVLEKHTVGTRAGITFENRESARPGKSSRRELKRLHKKLGELGTVTFTTVHTPFDVLLHFEEYLLLEAQSWKGRRGTAIQAAKRHAAFARQAISDLAKLDACKIHMLRLNDKLIASLIVYEKNGCFFPWKIAHDEAYQRFSPGKLLMVRTTEMLTAQKNFKMADSLARLNGSWMDRLWSDQFEFVDIAIASSQPKARELLSIGQFRHRLKSAIKYLIKYRG